MLVNFLLHWAKKLREIILGVFRAVFQQLTDSVLTTIKHHVNIFLGNVRCTGRCRLNQLFLKNSFLMQIARCRSSKGGDRLTWRICLLLLVIRLAARFNYIHLIVCLPSFRHNSKVLVNKIKRNYKCTINELYPQSGV